MGLERIASVLEGVSSAFDIRAFAPLLGEAAALLHTAPTSVEARYAPLPSPVGFH